jgi:hypothetical protein
MSEISLFAVRKEKAATLADTDAGPSVVTQSLLDLLPEDACISRSDTEHPPFPVRGPDGSPLITRGHVHLSFSVSEIPFRHQFLVIEGHPMLLLGNDFLAAHAAVISLNQSSEHGTIALSSLSSSSKPIQFDVSTSPRSDGLQTVASTSCSPECEPLPVAKPREPFTSPFEGQDAFIETLFASADQYAAQAPVSSSSEYLLYADRPVPVRVPGLSQVTFSVPVSLALRDHADCAFFVDRLPPRDAFEDVPLIIPRVESATADFKVRVTVDNLSEKALTLPSLQAVASLQVRFRIHEGASKEFPEDSPPTDKLSPEQLALLDSAVIDPDNQLTPPQREHVRHLLARRIAAFAINPKYPNHAHLLEVEIPLNPGSKPHRHAPSSVGTKREKIIDREVSQMEKEGIIRKSNSA